MPRIIFPDNSQINYLKEVKLHSGLNSDQLAQICGVVGRSFRDWARGKFSISQQALIYLQTRFPDIQVSQHIKIVDDFWYTAKGAKRGGLRRFELYGPPGTQEGWKKGGVISQLRRKEDPEKYKLLGCNTRKIIKTFQLTEKFAEVAGIILGDGAISNSQLRISVSSLVDGEYARFICSLFEVVFNFKPSWSERRECHTINLTISGVNLVEELERWGFVRGNKVDHQVDFPKWIWRDIEFQKACARGLMDTDGGCYFHKHKTNGLWYQNFGLSFANKSLPLVRSMAKVLKSLRLKFSIARGTQIYIYSFEEIKKYFNLIGSNNPKNWNKFNYYFGQKTHRIL